QTKAKIDAENKAAQAKADATNAHLQKEYQAKLAKLKSKEKICIKIKTQKVTDFLENQKHMV
ncbi:hypothetical protein LZU48_00205, partial [Streptococcus agalactiae]|nr:hypothetical protein [Streptococcus agalactiae]MCK6287969.1 hypothetical protein [Streptococcus agalactiae]